MKIKSIFFLISFFSLFAFAEPICSERSGKSALVVIDMQPYFVKRGGVQEGSENKGKVDKLLKEQVETIKRAKEAQIPIVFIEYEGPDIDETNSTLKDAVKKYSQVKFIKKNTDGMFDDSNSHKQELADYLKKNQIGTLLITGANGGACVSDSINGALDSNCSVVAFSKGIADFNYKEFIYPYAGHYTHIKPNCKNCTFKEVSSVDAIENYMVNNKGTFSKARVGKPKRTTGKR